METVAQILKNSNALNMMASEQALMSESDWQKQQRLEREEDEIRVQKEREFWESHPTKAYTPKEVDAIISRIVPERFKFANKDKIDNRVWDLTEDFFKGNGLFLWGKPGTGKTYFCSAIIREYFFRNQREKSNPEEFIPHHQSYLETERPLLITVPDILARIKASFGRQEKKKNEWGEDVKPQEMTEDQIINKLKEKKILFLDDLGTEKATDWSLQTIYQIIDYRYREEMQTVITSNLSLNELSDRTSDRITSRIAEMCKVIELKGTDRRLKK